MTLPMRAAASEWRRIVRRVGMRITGPPEQPVEPDTALDDEGYIMVALLIGMAVMAIWTSAALPAWRQQAIREKEAELIFRGEQYARAIFLYRQENGQAPPPNLDTLVNRRYLRKKYLDPMTGEDFVPIAGATAAAGAGRGGAGQGQQGAGPGQIGITGVRSTSTEQSIVVYQNQQVYSQFPFDWTFEAQRAGAMGPIVVVPGGGNVPGRIQAIPARGRAGAGLGRGRGGRDGGAGPDGAPNRGGQFGGARGRGSQ